MKLCSVMEMMIICLLLLRGIRLWCCRLNFWF